MRSIPRLVTIQDFQRAKEAEQSANQIDYSKPLPAPTPEQLAHRMKLQMEARNKYRPGQKSDGRYGRWTKTTFNPW